MGPALERASVRAARLLHTAATYAGWVAVRDIPNLYHYRRDAPLWAQRIWITPSSVERALFGYREESSALVRSGDWDLFGRSIHELPKIRASYQHWEQQVPWEQTGVFGCLLQIIREHGQYDGCCTREELVYRYQTIDAMFDHVKAEGRLRTRRELTGRRAFRELGGIRVHIGRYAEPIFGGSGQHRLAIAQVLGLGRIPAQVGMVHAAVVENWRGKYA